VSVIFVNPSHELYEPVLWRSLKVSVIVVNPSHELCEPVLWRSLKVSVFSRVV